MLASHDVRRGIERITHSMVYTLMHIFLSIYIVLAADFTVAFLPPGNNNTTPPHAPPRPRFLSNCVCVTRATPYHTAMDDVVAWTSGIAFIIFLIDLVLHSSMDRKQVYSFFWWMDLVCTTFGCDTPQSLSVSPLVFFTPFCPPLPCRSPPFLC